jgi:hypothetical protein
MVRDFAIYDEVVGWKHRQVDVARRFKMTQARVSQIVRDVGRQRAECADAIGSPLGLASRRLEEEWAEQRRNEILISEMRHEYVESSTPLKTTKTRRDGEGNIIFTEETVREVKKNHQIAKTILRLSERLNEKTRLPPPPEQPSPEQAAAAERERQVAELRQQVELEELTKEAEALATARKEREERKLKSERLAAGDPKWDEDLSTPERWGQYFARKGLSHVTSKFLSLADAEVLNQQSSLSNGADYPSYFEICDRNINGVRVAKWVRELIPQPLLPTDEEAFLPVYHNLKEWNPHDREIVPYASSLTVDGHIPPRFGRVEQDVGWVERAAADDASVNVPAASDEPRGAPRA